MKKRYKVLLTVISFLLIIVGIFAVWLLNPYQAMEEANAVIKEENVEVTEEDWLLFETEKANSDKGLIFYPGARVEAAAYAPLAAKIANRGYKVVIIPMPLNLAVFGIDKADQVIENFPEVNEWYITGHSLGGSMAANYVKDKADNLSGLILLAAYPADSDDLSNNNLDVLSIYAENDSFATLEDIENSKKILPENTIWKEIEGGNHSQFGYYGLQRGDNQADISREKQQQEIIESILTFME